MTVILQGIAARVKRRQASSAQAATYASYWPACAKTVLAIMHKRTNGKL